MNKQKMWQKIPLFDLFLFLTILALPFYIFRFSLSFIPSTALEVLIYFTFLLGIISKKIKIKANISFYLPLAFVLSAFIAVFLDPQLSRAAGIFKAYFFDGFLLYLAVVGLGEKYLPKILKTITSSGVLVSLVALTMFVLGLKSQDGRLLDLDQLSPNYLSMFLVPILVVSIYNIIRDLKDGSKVNVSFAKAVIILSTIILTGSRGAYLSLPVGVLIAIYQFVPPKISKLYKIISTIVAIALVGGTLWFFRPVFGDMGRTGSSSNIRYYIWTTSIEIASKNPLSGIGLSNFQDYFTQMTKGRINYSEYIAPQALTAHNLYLHVYLTMGLFGLVTFAVMLWSALKRSKRVVIIGAIVSILVYGFVDTPIFRNDLSGLFWLLLALL